VRTIGQLWRQAVAADLDRPAYLVEGEDGWEEVSWAEAGRTVDELANGLLALGVRKGDAFGILAQTTLEWALFDYALARIGAVGAAVYANSSPKDCRYVLEHSDAIGVLVEDEDQRAKIADVELRHVLTFADLDEVRARGRKHAAANPDALAEAEAQIGEEDLFTFIYTSGTTGPPKACMIRHRNYYEMATCIDRVPEFALGDDVMLLYLPLAHNFGRLMHLLGAHKGFTTTHQVIADVREFGGGLEVAHRLAEANLITNKNLLPNDRPEDWDRPSGLRIGTTEVTRLGMGAAEMDAIADLIARVLVESEDPATVKANAQELRAGFQAVRYTF